MWHCPSRHLALAALAGLSLAPAARAGRLATELSPYLLALDAGAVGWGPWSPETFAEARHAKRPVFVLVGRARPLACAGAERALLERADVVETLGRRFVGVAVDADERPDIADLLATMPVALGQEPEQGDGAAWAVLTADAWPLLAGRVQGDGAWRDGFAARLDALASDFDERRGDTLARAGVALFALRQAQTSDAALGTLGRDVVERALVGLNNAYDPATGRFGQARHAPLRLLLAEAAQGHAGARRLLASAIEALTRAPLGACESALFESAGRLRALTLAYAQGGQAHTRAAAQREAETLLSLRDTTGALRAAPDDTRVFASDNGWAIGALALSGATLARPGDIAAARAAATAVLARLGPPAALRRVARGDDVRGSALLLDYAALAEGLLDLDDAARDERARAQAAQLADAALGRFADPRGGTFDTDAAHDPLPARVRDGYDGAGLSAHGVLAGVLLRLGAATGEARQRDLARATLTSFLGDLQRAPRGLETLAAAAGELLGRTASIAATPPVDTASARLTRGALTLALGLTPSRARPGDAVEARLALTIAPGASVNAHRPGTPDLAGLSLTLLTPELRAGAPAYPVPRDVQRRFAPRPVPAYVGSTQVGLPLHVPRERMPGPLRVRVRVSYQVCGARECQAPDSLVLEAPLEVVAP